MAVRTPARPTAAAPRSAPGKAAAPRAVPRPGSDLTSRAYWNGTIKMSLSRFFILSVLQDRAMHGYDVSRAVERATNGCCSPTEGTIYPALREFEEGGYVTALAETVGGRERRVYTVTDKGRAAFRVAVEAWMEITQCLVDCRPGAAPCAAPGATSPGAMAPGATAPGAKASVPEAACKP